MEQIKTLNAEICVSRLTNFKALLSDLNFSVDIQSQTIFKRIIQAKNIQIKQIKASTKSFIEKQTQSKQSFTKYCLGIVIIILC